MEMTIKELADELGVSKDKVKYQVRKLPSDYLVKKNNITYLTDTGIWHVKTLLGKKSGELPRELPSKLPTEEEKKIRELEIKVELLELQLRMKGEEWHKREKILNDWLEEKDLQLKQKTEDNEKLAKLIDQEQQLRMAEMTKQALLEEKPKGFWNKIFGK